jgi:hypothetical protein
MRALKLQGGVLDLEPLGQKGVDLLECLVRPARHNGGDDQVTAQRADSRREAPHVQVMHVQDAGNGPKRRSEVLQDDVARCRDRDRVRANERLPAFPPMPMCRLYRRLFVRRTSVEAERVGSHILDALGHFGGDLSEARSFGAG